MHFSNPMAAPYEVRSVSLLTEHALRNDPLTILVANSLNIEIRYNTRGCGFYIDGKWEKPGTHYLVIFGNGRAQVMTTNEAMGLMDKLSANIAETIGRLTKLTPKQEVVAEEKPNLFTLARQLKELSDEQFMTVMRLAFGGKQ